MSDWTLRELQCRCVGVGPGIGPGTVLHAMLYEFLLILESHFLSKRKVDETMQGHKQFKKTKKIVGLRRWWRVGLVPVDIELQGRLSRSRLPLVGLLKFDGAELLLH